MDNAVFNSLADDRQASLFNPLILVCLFVFVVLGIGTGYVLAHSRTTKAVQTSTVTGASVSAGIMYGSDDTTTFKDTAEGQLVAGGIRDEGQYHLVRSGGESQNVYLTSSLVDLSQFVGHKVKVWGQTQKAQYAGWLMDVGRLEVEQ